MRKVSARLLWLAVALVAIACLCGCKTKYVTTERWQHDTITIERAVQQWRIDTLRLHTTDTTFAEVVRYDTLQRVRERIVWRNGKVANVGKGSVAVVHDTIAVQQGSTHADTKVVQTERKPSWWETTLQLIGIGTIIAVAGLGIAWSQRR